MKKVLSLLLLAVFTMAVVFSGCTTQAPDQTASSTAENTSIKIVESLTGTGLDVMSQADYNADVTNNIFSNLIELTKDYEPEPGVAKSWKESEDGMSVTFYLRDDIYFTDGTKLTADDVVWSYNGFSQTPSAYQLFSSDIEGIEKVDDYTVMVTKLNPEAAIYVEMYLVPIYPSALYEQDPEAFAKNPIGSGAYKYSTTNQDGSVVLVANEEYFDGAPQIKEVTLIPSMDSSTSLIALQSGQVDVIENVPASQRSQIESDNNLVLTTLDTGITQSLCFCGEPFVGNQKLRETVMHAINPENLITIANKGYGTAPVNQYNASILPKGVAGVDISGNYDPELAKQLLAESEYDTSIPIEMYTDSSTLDIMTVIQSDLSAIGLTTSIAQLGSQGELVTKITEGDASVCVLYLGGYGTSLLPWMDFFSNNGPPYSGEKSDVLNDIMATLSQTTDKNTRLDLYQQAIVEINRFANFVPLINQDFSFAHSTRISGFENQARAIDYYKIKDLTISG